jgi:hypothetical protein
LKMVIDIVTDYILECGIIKEAFNTQIYYL